MDQSALNTVRSSISSIVNLSEARNISKMRKQKPNEIEWCTVNYEPTQQIKEVNHSAISTVKTGTDSSELKKSSNDPVPFGLKNQNQSSWITEKPKEEKSPSKENKISKRYEKLGLASKLIQSILESVDQDPSLQLALLDECQWAIESKHKKSVKAKSGNIKLRQAVRKHSNKENGSIEYEVALSSVQDMLSHHASL